MIRNRVFFKYIRTFGITLSAVVIVVICVQLFLYYNARADYKIPKKIIKLEKDVYSKKIEAYLNEEKKFPKDVSANLNLATLYGLKKEFAKQEAEYKKILLKTNGKNYEATYNLAMLYLEQKRYKEACELIENVKYMSLRQIAGLKAKFYKVYADKLYEQKRYEEALIGYNNTVIYRNKLKKNSKNLDIREHLINTYIALSDEATINKNFDTAINYINTALNYEQTPELYYKLAILYMNKDLEQSVEYFEITKRLSPTIINYNLYMQALVWAQHIAMQQNQDDKAAIYAVKIRGLKRYIGDMFVKSDEFEVLYHQPKIKNFLFSKKQKIFINFEIKNLSQRIINNLYMTVEIYGNNKLLYHSEQIVASKKEKFAPEAISPIFNAVFSVKKDLQQNIICKIYLTKNKAIPLELVNVKKINLR